MAMTHKTQTTNKTTADDLATARAEIVRVIGRLERCVGISRAAVATMPLLIALEQVLEMRREAEQREAARKQADGRN